MARARTDEAKDARRTVLIEAALEEFYERGFAAARMDDIAKRAGVSKGTLYLYFDTKEALFSALVETYATPNVERIAGIAAHAPTALDAIRAIAALAPHIIRESKLPRVMKIFISDAHSFPELVQGYRRKIIDQALGALTDVLKRAKEAGELKLGDPGLTARLVVAPMAFSAVWHVVFGSDPEAEIDLEQLFQMHARVLETALTSEQWEG